MAERIRVPFGMETRGGPGHIVLDGGPDRLLGGHSWKIVPVVQYANISLLTYLPDGATFDAASEVACIMCIAERRASFDCESQLEMLVNTLSSAHHMTLRHIMLHLRTVCARGPTNHNDAVGRISEVFQEILLRPPWSNIMYV